MAKISFLLFIILRVVLAVTMNFSWRDVEHLSNTDMDMPTGQNQRRQANNVWRLLTQVFNGSEADALEFCLNKCGQSNLTDSEILNSVSQLE